MTTLRNPTLDSTGAPVASLLPFNAADMASMRVRPADFARICNVSRQTVSQWIKRGIVTLGPDGRLDPVKAAREVARGVDPARLRARVFQQVIEPNEELRKRVADLERDNELLRLAATLSVREPGGARLIAQMLDEIAREIPKLSTQDYDQVMRRLDEISGAVLYGLKPEDFEPDCADTTPHNREEGPCNE